jgi:hypothetical protein
MKYILVHSALEGIYSGAPSSSITVEENIFWRTELIHQCWKEYILEDSAHALALGEIYSGTLS